MTPKEKKVTVIIPCRNEEKHIAGVLENIIRQDYPKEYMEVFAVDGMSGDNTAGIVKRYADEYDFIYYMDNPHGIVPHALNKAILASGSEVIIRMDAHAEYPDNYISSLVHYLYMLEADNVGGAWITAPGDDTVTAFAISAALSSRFGVGNAYYRLANESVRQVDTVPFGCYRRDIFEKLGLFDEELVRNQDDEFNGRIINNRGRIFLVPEIKIKYYARPTLGKTVKMFYQYGLFKPLVLLKLGQPATLRQFAPVLFFLLLPALPVSFFINNIIFISALAIFVVYWIINLFYSSVLSLSNKNIRMFFILPFIFFSIHVSYGFGYVLGIIRFLVMKKHRADMELSR